jgi:putative membrane protein
MRAALVFSLVLAVLAVVFALQNPQVMEVNLLFFRTEGSKALVLIITFALGVVVGLLSMLPGRIRDKRALKKLRSSSSTGSGSSTSGSGTSGSSASGSAPTSGSAGASGAASSVGSDASA